MLVEYKPGTTFPGVIGRTVGESSPAWPAPLRAKEGAPNVLFIVLDDTGFGQLSCYGSPINTPNINRLAENGLRYTNTHTPGKIKNGDTGDVAIDHYHRYKEDVALMKIIGANPYRFSISWPRIIPKGAGQPNQTSVDFYNRLVDELKSARIESFATLYHWDLPQTFQDKFGVWQSRETAKAFGDYAGYVAKNLSDRVRHFFTINEFKQVTETAYRIIELSPQGKTAPRHGAHGLTLEERPLNQMRHHAVLGHGMAVQAIRAMGRAGTKFGQAENLGHAIPIIDSPEHVKAVVAATRAMNIYFLGPLLEGRYSDAYLKAAGKDAPKFTDSDRKIIVAPLDFVGVNVYIPLLLVKASNQPSGYEEAPFSLSHPKMFSDWRWLVPESQYWSPRLLHEMWKPKEIYITENGCAANDKVAPDGNVYDSDRILHQGTAITEAIFGVTNPGGNLPFTLPRHVGQMPIHHAQQWGSGYRRTATDIHKGYLDMPSTPLFPLGHGLSYTTFDYSPLKLKAPRLTRAASFARRSPSRMRVGYAGPRLCSYTLPIRPPA